MPEASVEPAKVETPSFSDSLGHDIINIIFAPPQSTSKSYYIHANKLRSESEYFAGLLRFPGIESQTNTVTLSEGYDGLHPAFECFIEWLYTGSYYRKEADFEFSGLPLVAKIIVLTEKFIAKRCQKEAVDRLGEMLNAVTKPIQEPGRDGNQRLKLKSVIVAVFPKIIRTIYDGVPRPYQMEWHERCRKAGLPIPKSAECLASLNQHRETYRRITLGYTNCRVRKLVADHASRHLSMLRETPEFRAVVEDIGEFAGDLMMEIQLIRPDGYKVESGMGLVELVD